VKWFVEEPGSTAACAILTSGEVLLAPDLVLVEVGNTAWKKVTRGEITQEQGEAMLRALPLYFDRLVHPDVLIARAYALAHRLAHPVYDCLYLALAEQEDVRLITDDQRLMKVVSRTEFRKRVRSLVSGTR
ncbi:MAG: type II toxin-antitoxin system VapC family toxin, partial [Nitrospira sp.]|nr:type II toxin-antitoxin system VapC family toxin [Nitrospira sp.]